MPCFADTSNHSSSLCSSPQEGELEAVSCSFASSHIPPVSPGLSGAKLLLQAEPFHQTLCPQGSSITSSAFSPESRELASEQRFLINSTTSFTQPDLTWFGHRSLTLHGQLTVSRETSWQCVPETLPPLGAHQSLSPAGVGVPEVCCMAQTQPHGRESCWAVWMVVSLAFQAPWYM